MTNPEPSNDGGGGVSTWLVIAVVGLAIVLLSVPAWAFVQNVVLSGSTDSTLLETAATTTSSTTVPTTTVGQVTTTSTVFEDTAPISGGTTSTSGATTNTTGDVGTTTAPPSPTTTAPSGTTTPPTTTPPTTAPPSPTTTAPPSPTTTKAAPPGPTTTTQAPKTVAVTLVDNKFSPISITINVGDRIRWTNGGAVDHTTTSLGNWESGTLTPGDSFLSPVFDSPDKTFNYFCRFHGEMTATVVVNP